jgi:hypothetical protein
MLWSGGRAQRGRQIAGLVYFVSNMREVTDSRFCVIFVRLCKSDDVQWCELDFGDLN